MKDVAADSTISVRKAAIAKIMMMATVIKVVSSRPNMKWVNS